MKRRARPAHRRLSESGLWEAQRRFYARTGIDAWRTGTVPHHVTSNVALATAYARVVVAFLRDTSRREPLYVLELGAGSGRFGFLFLRALDALRVDAPVRYVMTDVADATIDVWRSHEAFTPFLRAGRLDFARFDAETDRALRLERERRTIAPEAPVPRLVVIANYVFSGLRHDAFAIRAGTIHEYLVATVLRRRGPADASLAWRMGARATAPYPEAHFNAILDDYAATRAAGRVLFPVGALRCLERLAALARESLLVLAADRGSSEVTDAITDAADLRLGRHGAVSFPVNFHALRAWTIGRGGQVLRPPHGHRHVHVAGFLRGARGGPWPETRRAYEAAMANGGPDALYGLRRGLSAVAERLRPADIVSLIRLCGPDPRVVAECVRPLWPHLADADAPLRRDLRDAVIAAWPNYYHLGEVDDLPFTLALLLYEVRAYADARALFEESLRLYGDDAATRWNLGLCHVALGKPDEAIASFERAQTLAPDLHPAGLVTIRSRRPSAAARGSGGRPPRPRASRR